MICYGPIFWEEGSMKSLVAILAVTYILGGVASAAPITYTETLTASGTLGGTTFTDALVTVTLTGDTSNVTAGPVPHTDVLVNTGSATVSVSGIGTGTFT